MLRFTVQSRELTDLIRRFVATGSEQLFLVHDNCRFHRTEKLLEAFAELEVNEVPTVPYSPQLNEPVENYFGLQKREMANVRPQTVIMSPELEHEIKAAWAKANIKFTAEKSAKLYGQSIVHLRDCADGQPLHNNHTRCQGEFLAPLRNVMTWRKEE